MGMHESRHPSENAGRLLFLDQQYLIQHNSPPIYAHMLTTIKSNFLSIVCLIFSLMAFINDNRMFLHCQPSFNNYLFNFQCSFFFPKPHIRDVLIISSPCPNHLHINIYINLDIHKKILECVVLSFNYSAFTFIYSLRHTFIHRPFDLMHVFVKKKNYSLITG